MDPLRIAALVVALPGVLALVVAAGARRWTGGAAIALAVAAVAGAWAVLGAPELWPVGVSHRFFHVIAAGLIAAVAGRSRTLAGHAVQAIAGLAAVWLVIGPVLEHRFPGARAIVAIAAGAAALAAVWLGLDRAGARGDRSGLLIAAIAAGAAALGAGLSGSVVIAELGGAAAAGLGAIWLVSLRGAPAKLLAGAAPLAAVIIWAVVAMAVLYASMTAATALAILAIAPVAAAVPLLVRRRGHVASVASAVILAGAATAFALAPGLGDAPASGDDYGYGYE